MNARNNNTKTIEFAPIPYLLDAVFFFYELKSFGRQLERIHAEKSSYRKRNLLRRAASCLYDNFSIVKGMGYFKEISFDKVEDLKSEEELFELLGEFGEEFGIDYNAKRIKRIELDTMKFRLWEEPDVDKLILPYKEVYIIPYDEVFPILDHALSDIPSKNLYIKKEGGIFEEDLVKIFKDHLPRYGDHKFYESLTYWWDYKGIPVYLLFIGS
ncbi:MAG: hypothetical protein GF311_06400 [Candidatus Lokiarchaeota archaeon]|nr:hypothetical protein [Candidatus Lokiarchaeota archaeon]